MTSLPTGWRKVNDESGELEEIQEDIGSGQMRSVLDYRDKNSLQKVQVMMEKDALEGILYYWRYDTGKGLEYEYDNGTTHSSFKNAKDAALEKLERETGADQEYAEVLVPPKDQESPFTIDIVWEGGSGTDSNVDTWYYEGTTLWVSYANGETVDYPYGNVVNVH